MIDGLGKVSTRLKHGRAENLTHCAARVLSSRLFRELCGNASLNSLGDRLFNLLGNEALNHLAVHAANEPGCSASGRTRNAARRVRRGSRSSRTAGHAANDPGSNTEGHGRREVAHGPTNPLKPISGTLHLGGIKPLPVLLRHD